MIELARQILLKNKIKSNTLLFLFKFIWDSKIEFDLAIRKKKENFDHKRIEIIWTYYFT